MKVKYLKYILEIIAILFIIFIINPKETQAATASISCTSTATVNSPITISVSGSAVQWNLKLKVNGTVIASSSELENYTANKGISFSGSYTPNSTGTVTVSLEGTVTDFNTGATTRSFSPKTITVNAATTNNGGSSGTSTSSAGTASSSSNNVSAPTLSNLGIKPYDFSGFSPSKTAYSVNVPNDCTSVNLYATSKNGTVSGTGNKTLKEGTNKFTVTVSNSAGSKSYTVSIIRKTLDSEDVPNVIEEEPQETEEAQGIGLTSLEIPDIILEPEFKADVYEYTVKTDKELTLEELMQIKEKIVALANNENVIVEVTPAISEDGIRTITIAIKDAEREYAKYVITFIVEEKEEGNPVLAPLTNISNNDGNNGLFGLEPDQKAKVLMGCYGITLLLAIIFGIIAFVQTRKVKNLLGDEDDYDYDEKINFELTSNFILNNNEESRMIELENNSSNPKELAQNAVSKLEKLDGYRNPRSRRATGRHF